MKDNNGSVCLGLLVVHIQDRVLLYFLYQVERKSSYKSGILPARKGKRSSLAAWLER